MSSSSVSNTEDNTPSDSGVQMMDSESSELMIESFTSQTGIDFEDLKNLIDFGEDFNNSAEVKVFSVVEQVPLSLKCDYDKNSNVMGNKLQDVMNTSNCSTFDTENIVYRRKIRKSTSVAKTPKKRVSFHEDILKNTRTDNIHIEHGFVTYKNGRKAAIASIPGRYSWCSDGDGGELCSKDENQESRVVYRNACSDVLDYGNSDVYKNTDSNYLKYDNSGVFEYNIEKIKQHKPDHKKDLDPSGTQALYKCSCSSSNSSLDSEETDKNSNNRKNYGQSKSSSCDCIGMNNTNNNFIDDNCYFSEPNIGILNDGQKKSVWSKEKKPKSSCLKKTKRHTNIINEQDLNNKIKKFNVHDMNQLIDNSKMIFGSLKSIFTIPLPERGVPEGSEDVQSVYECLPEVDQCLKSPSPIKQRKFLSKSLDGSKEKNIKHKFVHNVDEQLRRKNDGELIAPTRQNSAENETESTAASSAFVADSLNLDMNNQSFVPLSNQPEFLADMSQFRNKFIINCESTVFEHTGVSYSSYPFDDQSTKEDGGNLVEKVTPIALPEPDQLQGAFMSVPIKQTFAYIIRTFKENTTSPTSAVFKKENSDVKKKSDKECFRPTEKIDKPKIASHLWELSDMQSISSDQTSTTNTSASCHKSAGGGSGASGKSSSSPRPAKHDLRNNLDKQSRHLSSPLKKRHSGTCFLTTVTARYDNNPSRMSPDLFNLYAGGGGRDSKCTILSEEFDDILTITTDTDKNESDIVIVDYPEVCDRGSTEYAIGALQMQQHLIKPQTKRSLINRFLRNVTQKKMLETTIRKNNFFASKIKNEQKLFGGNLYLPGVKPRNIDLIEDLNGEIAMEIEMSATNSPRRELVGMEACLPGDISRFELGIGEISIDIFNGNYVHIICGEGEILMKVFKLYTGYNREGFMTPVLVFLTDKTLYVADLVRNCLCCKFVLAYSDLDVILMAPYGNTVLLSNSDRDMQQVLLAGGPYSADGLVANVELCARRGGFTLPTVGQLTLEHLEPLQAFVRDNSTVSKDDTWMYYAVVNVPASTLGSEKEPLGPHVKGFLMHRRIKERAVNSKQTWNPGYFLLKTGVLYMFNDSSQKLPSWAMALAECQGARRAVKVGRPHCFEILLKSQLIQLAAPDEYVASEWLQALLQSASGLFEMQEKHKTLGCTLVVTKNHLITLREDFAAPLKQINKSQNKNSSSNKNKTSPQKEICDHICTESTSIISSARSTPTKMTYRSNSMNSTPTRISEVSRSLTTTVTYSKENLADDEKSYTNMSSVYGKKSGIEILTCADIKEMTGIKIPSHNDTWWCVLEFSCQEVRESSDDLVIFFASSSEMQRFLRMLEQLWQTKNNDLFPITVLDEDDIISEHCTLLYMDINRSWEPLLSAALGYPL